MRLNELKPATGGRKAATRVGRGVGSGLGKTGGRGHKGQKSRSGGYHKVGFEGGQMPLQRRVPKRGFRSRGRRFNVEVRLGELAGLEADVITPEVLRERGVVPARAKSIKVIRSGTLDNAVTIRGVGVTRGARAAIEAAGGKVED